MNDILNRMMLGVEASPVFRVGYRPHTRRERSRHPLCIVRAELVLCYPKLPGGELRWLTPAAIMGTDIRPFIFDHAHIAQGIADTYEATVMECRL